MPSQQAVVRVVAGLATVTVVAAFAGCSPEPVPVRTARYTPRTPPPATATTRPVDLPTRAYTNATYGFTCQIPSEWTATEAEDGSGISAVSPDGGANVRCVGGKATDGQTVDSERNRATADFEAAGLAITATSSDETTYRVSAASGELNAISWGVVGTDQYRSLVWEYPNENADLLQAAVERSIQTFQAGNVGDPVVQGG